MEDDSADDLMVIDLANGGRVVVQLAPRSRRSTWRISRRWRAAAIGTAPRVYRVQDNYVAQWGQNDSEQALAGGRERQAPRRIYAAAQGTDRHSRSALPTLMRRAPGFADGWPVALQRQGGMGGSCPLLWQRGRRPRPCARYRYRRRTLCRHRPGAAPARPQYCACRPSGRRDRPVQHAAARHRGAWLLQGQGAICADCQRPARERHAGGRAAVLSRSWTRERRPSPVICSCAPIGTTISTSGQRAASTCATSRCRCSKERRPEATQVPKRPRRGCRGSCAG